MVSNKQDEINRKRKLAREAAAKAKRTKKPVVTEDIGTLPKEHANLSFDERSLLPDDPSPQAIKGSSVETKTGQAVTATNPQIQAQIQPQIQSQIQPQIQSGVGGVGRTEEERLIEARVAGERSGFTADADALISHLEQQQLDPLDLTPRPLGQVAGEAFEGGVGAIADPLFNKAGRDEFVEKLYGGNITGDDAIKLAKGELNALKNQGITAGAILSSVFASKLMGTKLMSLASQSKFAAHASKTTGIVKGIAEIAAVGFGIYKASDFNRGKIAALDGQLSTLVSNSSTLLSEVEKGMPVDVGLELAQKMSDELDEIEQGYLIESEFNIKYRNSEEHIMKMRKLNDARANLNERVLGIRNIGLTGTAQYDPLQAMLSINDLK